MLLIGVFAVAALGVTGYVADDPSLAAVFPGGSPIAAIAGLLMVLQSAATWSIASAERWKRAIGRALASGVALVGLIEAGLFLAIPDSLIWLPSHGTTMRLHIPPLTSILFIMIAAGVVTSHLRQKMLSNLLGSTVFTVSLIVLFGYAFEVPWFVDPRIRVLPVLAATVAFLMLSGALLLVEPSGWVRVLMSRSSAGTMARLLLPAAVAIPILTALVVHSRDWGTALSSGDLTTIVAVNMIFAAATVLGSATMLDRREAETQHLAAIVASSSDAIYGKAIDGTILSWNSGAEQIYGYSAAEAVGRSVKMLAPDDHLAEIESILHRIRNGERIESFETRRVRKDGTPIDISITMSPMRNEWGQTTGVSTIVRDITTQKAAARALLASESRFRTLFDSNIVGIMFWEADGRIVEANDEFLRITGYTHDEIAAGSVLWSAITPTEWVEQDRQKLGELLATGTIAPFEKEYLHKDGRRIPVLIGAAVGAESSSRGIAITLDITDRRRAETLQQELTQNLERAVAEQTAELRQRAAALESAAQRLAHSNRELEAFTYSVSHDLRAPLRAMDGFSRILVEEYRDRIDTRFSDYLLRIRRATERMSSLIDDLLLLSRVGRQQLRSEDADLSACARSILAELSAADPARMARISIGGDIRAEGDPALLRIVLQNLLSNAWKFTSRRPLAEIEFGEQQTDSGRWFFVRDNGAGFDARYVDKLFTPFQRLHSAAEFEGTGIGLALVERIISRHGGVVRAEGEPDRGATFFFTLDEQNGEMKC